MVTRQFPRPAELLELMNAPLKYWGIPELAVERFERYVLAIAPALLAAIPDAGEFVLTRDDYDELELVYRSRRPNLNARKR